MARMSKATGDDALRRKAAARPLCVLLDEAVAETPGSAGKPADLLRRQAAARRSHPHQQAVSCQAAGAGQHGGRRRQ